MGNVCEHPYHIAYMCQYHRHITHIIQRYDIWFNLYIDHMSIHLVKYYNILNTVL